MSVMIKEVYEALEEAGASPEKASAAAQAVTEKLVTKDDLHNEMQSLEIRLIDRMDKQIKWVIGMNVGTLIAMTAIFGAIVKMVP